MSNLTGVKTNILKRDIKRRLTTIQTGIRTALGAAWDAGELLNELKGRMKHGEWLPWLASIELGERQAQKYMRLASSMTREEALTKQTIESALEDKRERTNGEKDKSRNTNSNSDSKSQMDIEDVRGRQSKWDIHVNKTNRDRILAVCLAADYAIEHLISEDKNNVEHNGEIINYLDLKTAIEFLYDHLIVK